MYRLDGSRTKGLTSSVTAAMRSPKVVLITFCRRIVFSSVHDPNGYLFVSRLADIDVLLLDYSIPTVGRANFMPDEWDVVKYLYMVKMRSVLFCCALCFCRLY